MADLDDFFAKKDRKKGKSSKKFSTTEEVAKKLEDTAKKAVDASAGGGPTQQPKKVKERLPQDPEGAEQDPVDQDEWKEFEEEKKDYSGLKIGNLTLGPSGEQGQTTASNEAGSGEPSEGGEQTSDSEKKVGPWKRIEIESAAAPKAAEPPNVQGGRYVPPSLVRANQLNRSQPLQSRLRSKGVAPDIHNEEFFPTLSKSSENKKNRNEGAFEMVQQNRASSYRNQQAEQNKMAGGAKLALGNRFNTLSNDS